MGSVDDVSVCTAVRGVHLMFADRRSAISQQLYQIQGFADTGSVILGFSLILR